MNIHHFMIQSLMGIMATGRLFFPTAAGKQEIGGDKEEGDSHDSVHFSLTKIASTFLDVRAFRKIFL
jgi:hypothetical protein